jgi:methionyl-tRNA formyltransferase
MRVLLITSHYMGVLYMQELQRAGENIVGVVAWPDDGGWFVPPECDVRTQALRSYLPLYEPDPKDLNGRFLPVIEKLAPDMIISGYYPKIFSRRLLSIPPKGCINTHPTGLPRFRGLSPYFTHMLFGDSVNRITLHWLDPGVDTGDTVDQGEVEVRPDDTGFTCGQRLTEAGRDVWRKNWPLIKEGRAPRVKQDPKLASNFNFDWSMAEINWSKPAFDIGNLVRCLTKPMKGTWTRAAGHKLRVWKVRVIEPTSELPATNATPGEVLAITGRGLWVQTGKGQVEIIEASFDDDPDVHASSLLRLVCGPTRMILE